MKTSEVPERKGFVIPDFIYDTFNLSLLEAGQDNDYYTIEELKVLVADRIKELNRLGYKVSADQILEYEIINTTDITAGIKSLSDKQYKFVIAKLAARRKNEKYLDTIIYHELCHAYYPNHTDEFYNLLSLKMPNWEKIKEKMELKLLSY